MSYESALNGLDAALKRMGEVVTIRRPGSAPIDVQTLARVEGVSAQFLRTGSSSQQGNFRAIFSPTDLIAAGFPMPLRATDKIVRGGVERQITFVHAIPYGTSIVRVEIDFIG